MSNRTRKRSRAQKRAAIARRTAFERKKHLENIAVECKRSIHRSRSLKTQCLQTNPELLKTAVYVAPNNQEQIGHSITATSNQN